MDFQAVLPMPPILRNVACGSWQGDDAGAPVFRWYERRGPDRALLERRRLTAAEEAELDALPCDNAYDWCCEIWGTKWNAVDATRCWPGGEPLRYDFKTAWSPPEGIVQTLRERFPQLHISAFFDEPMMEIGGYY